MKKISILFSLTLVIAFLNPVFSQDFSSIDLKTINIDNLTDEQIQKFVERAQASGMTQSQLEELARQRGMSEVEISKLRTRIYSLNPELAEMQSSQGGTTSSISRLREDPVEPDPFEERGNVFEIETGLPIFALDFFQRQTEEVTFSSPLNIPTPANYLLGAGDEIIIDVYGASEISYQNEISPDGQIIISGVGPIKLAGLEVDAARSKIFNRLSSIYSGLKGSNPNTFLQVTVGNIRTISVNVIGQVVQPGTYTLSSFSSAFNAIYAAGGPTMKGSLRSIRVIRNAEEIATLDVYKYLFTPEKVENIVLQDGDNIIVDSYLNRVSLTGAVKQQAKFEMLEEETLADLFKYSGGFAEDAFSENVVIERSTSKMKSILSVTKEEFASVKLQMGDSINIGRVIDRFENRVSINGAVFRPGDYQLEEGMMLSDLIAVAEGLREDAFLGRGSIFRLNSDLSLKNISFSVQDIQSGSADVVLQRDDQIVIQSIFDLRAALNVQIKGEIRKPGIYQYLDGMTVEDLITRSGGFKESANKSVVEVARQLSSESGEIDRTARIFTFEIDESLKISDSASSFELQPFDVILIKRSSYYQTQKLVKIEGEVLYPGFYALETREDKISDLIERAGGLTEFAYAEGATILRRNEYFEDTASIDEVSGELEAELYRSNRLQELQRRDADSEIGKRGDKESIGINLKGSIEGPGSKFDLILKDGDILSVPKRLQTVRVRGNVLYPNTIRYEQGMSAKRAISSSGGFTDDARPGKTYVIYANGSAERTKKFLWFKNYPNLEPGAEVIVPQRVREREPLNAQQIIGLTSSLATLVLVITQINR
ncbi:MAG: SLBB domain-containing protein [Ekhidna sp.]|uniref:SLBB domain-containing protein n=1 Tax=Ekhidna sp. TaxID=2608089 RepID=UPI0032EEE7E4